MHWIERFSPIANKLALATHLKTYIPVLHLNGNVYGFINLPWRPRKKISLPSVFLDCFDVSVRFLLKDFEPFELITPITTIVILPAVVGLYTHTEVTYSSGYAFAKAAQYFCLTKIRNDLFEFKTFVPIFHHFLNAILLDNVVTR